MLVGAEWVEHVYWLVLNGLSMYIGWCWIVWMGMYIGWC